MELSAALKLGRELMASHGLGDWVLNLDRARTRAGACRPARREISLSAHLTRLHPEMEVRDTILHEIAHALVGPGHGQTRSGARRHSRSAARASAARPPRPPSLRCLAGDVRQRARDDPAPDADQVAICTLCVGPERARVLDWTYHGQRVPMHPNYVAELDALLLGLPQLARSPAPRRGGPRRRTGSVRRSGGTHRQARAHRYRVRVPDGVLSVPFAWVERAG